MKDVARILWAVVEPIFAAFGIGAVGRATQGDALNQPPIAAQTFSRATRPGRR